MLRRPARLILAVAVLATVLAGRLPARAASEPPHLSLLAPESSVKITKFGHDPVYLNLGVFVASSGGAFEVDVRRTRYQDPIQAAQVVHATDGTTTSVPLPDRAVPGWDGLARFFTVTITDVDDQVVRDRAATFCPNAWDQQRVDDSGPLLPTFPPFCSLNPLTRGTVWGIDRGWAAGAFSSSPPRVRLAAGVYNAHVEIADSYATLLGVDPAEASVDVRVVIRDLNDPCQEGCEHPTSPERGSSARQLTPAPRLAAPSPRTLPDLRPLPAFGMRTYREAGRDYLSFAANVWNAGPSPLVVEGFRRDDADVMDAYQYFFRDGEVVGRARVGSLEYDPRRGHNHWHFKQFARYRLLDATMTEAVRSGKEAFCLAPTDPINLLKDGATLRPDQIGLTTACGYVGSIWIRETLPVGWGDTYFQGVAGQAFDITGVPNGTYYVQVETNPLGRLYERTRDDDVSLRKVYLRGVPGDRRVSVPPYRGIDTEARWG
jgi:hypothetical protein